MIRKKHYHISVVGLWHLGAIYSAGLAELGHTVVGVDEDAKIVEGLRMGMAPVTEPGVEALLKKHLASGRLCYTSEFSSVAASDIVWLTFDTPVNDADEADERVIFAALAGISPFLKNGVLIICSSQLGAGGTRKLETLVRKKRPKLNFRAAYLPENLQLGKALTSFLKPQRIVAGVRDDQTFSAVSDIFAPLGAPLLRMSPESAEMSKHALNAFLATSLSFIYDIADLCEKTGADVTDVAKALRSDPRIGADAYLDASIGFSGGTLGRDLKALLKTATKNGLSLPVIKSVWKKNHARRRMALRRLTKELGALRGKTIGLLGVTYKPGTPTLRRSLSLEIARLLEKAGASMRAADPGADERDMMAAHPDIPFFRDPYQMARGCQAILLLTGWPVFKSIRPAALARMMRAPKLFFDARNFLSEKEENFTAAGIRYRGVGRGMR